VSAKSYAVGVGAGHAIPAWAVFGMLGTVVSLVYLGGPMLHIGSPWLDMIYTLVAALAALAIFIGVRRNRPRARAAWLFIAAGQAIFALGDLIYLIQHAFLLNERYPGPADYLYLAMYPLTAIGLAILVRRRTPGWHLPSVIDAGILTTGAALLTWVYVIKPLHATTEGYNLEQTLITLAYPLADLLLLTVATFLLLGAGVRTAAYHLLIVGLAANLVTDVVYLHQVIEGTYSGGLIDSGWLLAYVLLGLAALHPSMRRLDERSPVAAPDATWGRLAALAAASLAAPGVLGVQYARGDILHVPLIVAVSTLLFLLVLTRMALLVATHRREAITDALTGLHTRRFFEESLRVEVERARRHGSGFGVLLFDIDHFKRVNDTYGHPGGDRVLVEVARRLRGACRAGDVVARYGGEEFGILLPGARQGDMARIAEHVRHAVAGTPIAVDHRTMLPVTVSGGSATWPLDGAAGGDVVLAADRALYEAKNAGRNRIVGFREPQAA
jgi:diguanylate cyclase (GGDEF)-like protein